MSNALTGQVAALYIQTSTTSGAFTEETLTDQGDHKHYHQPDVTKQTWDSTETLTVEKQTGGVGEFAEVSSGFSVVYDTGQIIFSVANGATDVIRVSGKRFPVSVVAAAVGWSLQGGPEALKVTPLGVSDEEYIAGDFSGKVTFKTLFTTGGQLSDYLAETLQVLLFVDTGTDKTRFYGRVLLSSDDVEAQEGQIVLQNVGGSFVEVPAYYSVVDYS